MTKKEIMSIKNDPSKISPKLKDFEELVGYMKKGTIIVCKFDEMATFIHILHKYNYVLHSIPDLMNRKVYIKILGRNKKEGKQ